MSRLDELIAQLCPNGVEYRTFGESATIVRGASPRPIKNFITTEPTGVNWIKIGDVKPGDKYITASAEKITPEGAKKSRTVKKGDFILSNSMSFGRPYILQIDGCIHDGWLAISDFSDSYLSDFLYHLLNSNGCQREMRKKASFGGAVQNLNADIVRSLVLPVPPLEVQREIVHILDSFTLLTAELTAELTARKKQYEFYRDELLSAKKNIPIVKLGDIAIEFYRGSGIKRDEITDTGIPCIRYGEIYTTYNTWFNKCVSHTKIDFVQSPKYFENGDILFAITGESVEDIAKSVAYIGHEKCLAGGDIVVMKHNQNPRYLAHVLATTEARMQKSKGKVKSKVVHSNVPSIKEIQIPLPPLEIQEKYANVLDNFEAICTDLNIGLPAEIEARQKQYEYYRDLLLTFAETGSTLMTDRQTDRQTGRAERN